MNDRNNTIAGWVLFAGIVALGASIVTGEMYKGERPETMGYPIEGVVEEGAGGEAEKPIAFFLQTADAAKGEAQFKKCAACHTIDAGGANGIGPALFGTLGKPIAGHAGFAYSDALKGVGGTWGWDNMSAWLANPKRFAPGTKMAFAGLSNPQDRADLLLFLNSKGGTLTVPPPPAEDAPAAGEDAAKADAEASSTAEKAEDVPVVPGAEEGRGKGDADAQGR
ncbi:c-type cytochrome [Sphingomonas xanthus]|uniref:Cytochrome c family protein n=1 Tax=Sphingomonas xanthus TaxID=2594473 RepID=A0A516IR44_9SPHN|nr:cytochrome c family protein [Sphingomonas xanthus]QDP19264.1 cytochrome c family protein [Sphingomonas xanthus]